MNEPPERFIAPKLTSINADPAWKFLLAAVTRPSPAMGPMNVKAP